MVGPHGVRASHPFPRNIIVAFLKTIPICRGITASRHSLVFLPCFFFWREYSGMIRSHLSLFSTLPFSIPNPVLRNALSWPWSFCIALSHVRRCLVLVQCKDTASHLLPMRKLVCTRKERFRSSPFGHAGCISSLATRRGWRMKCSTSPPNVSFRYIGGSKASSVEEV